MPARPWFVPTVISIHAPPRGATAGGVMRCPPRKDFNSRPSARGDQIVRQGPLTLNISIHAPPRGATSRRPRVRASGKFQFTPLREGRPGVSFSCLLWLSISIHAPPRGATAHSAAVRCFSAAFQFTPLREGRRSPLQRACWLAAISIHAPPRGATSSKG